MHYAIKICIMLINIALTWLRLAVAYSDANWNAFAIHTLLLKYLART